MQRRHYNAYITKGLTQLLCIAVGASMMVPLVWMLLTSLKSDSAVGIHALEWLPRTHALLINRAGAWEPAELVEITPEGGVRARVEGKELMLPEGTWKQTSRIDLHWENYARVLRTIPFFRFFMNTLTITLIVTGGSVFISSLAAYAFARMEFCGRNLIFSGYLATMMIPGAITAIPLFLMIRFLGGPELWGPMGAPNLYVLGHYCGRLIGTDSFLGLILPGLFGAYGTFLLRQSFLSIPRDLEDAARIDGCSSWGIYRNVIVPLSRNAHIGLGLLVSLGAWRDFFWPLILTNRMEMKTLTVGLTVFQGMYETQWNLMMAASILVMAPMVLLFLFTNNYFIEGIQLQGLKE